MRYVCGLDQAICGQIGEMGGGNSPYFGASWRWMAAKTRPQARKDRHPRLPDRGYPPVDSGAVGPPKGSPAIAQATSFAFDPCLLVQDQEQDQEQEQEQE